ncbi:hypothetical protein BDQ17DRAFT_1324214 [Cyathus striatus]|nr:hypothetical protein BDQ17DRAFT_1324214 [Cyathus striatus]
MARDLKINIRKRAVGSFFEWDRLDQATGGKDKPLGTKLYQDTRKAIAKHKPALMSAIKKFNKYCKKLAQLHKPEWNIPLPDPLPTQLSVLRDSSNLMEDVWITWTEGTIPKWLNDVNVELAALEVAAALPSNFKIKILLDQHLKHLLHLKPSWANALATEIRLIATLRLLTSMVKRFLLILSVEEDANLDLDENPTVTDSPYNEDILVVQQNDSSIKLLWKIPVHH